MSNKSLFSRFSEISERGTSKMYVLGEHEFEVGIRFVREWWEIKPADSSIPDTKFPIRFQISLFVQQNNWDKYNGFLQVGIRFVKEW